MVVGPFQEFSIFSNIVDAKPQGGIGMGFLLALTCLVIIYGTLYPFDFTTVNTHVESVLKLLARSVDTRSGLGDLIANIALFIPCGFFAMQCLFRRTPRFLQFLFVVILGAAFSSVIECAQIYLPSRTTSIYDFAMNVLGTCLGAVVGCIDWRRELSRLQNGHRPPTMFPVLLITTWIGYRLFPYVPTVDVQQMKDALKPLFAARLLPTDMLGYFITTLVIGRLLLALFPSGRLLRTMLLLPLGIIAVKPFIMTKVIAPSELVGVTVGVIFCMVFLERLQKSANIIAFLLMALIVIQGLVPFDFRPEPIPFSFIPFIGFSGGYISVSLLVFFSKLFLYGSLVWLLTETGRSLFSTLTISTILLTVIELLHMYVSDHVSEITDPLLAIIMGLALYFLDLRPLSSQGKYPS